MGGLVLKIAAGERFIINGATLENGDKPARIRVVEGDARVLRLRDAMHPDEVNSPVKRIYYAIQLLITGDLKEVDTVPAVDAACKELLDIFRPLDPDMIPTLRGLVSRGSYYSALCHLRQVLALEEQLLAMAPRQTQESKVA